MSGAIVNAENLSAPGFFGKLPALGDFVQRRLPQDFVQPWDQWLQGGIAGSKTQLGEHWLNTYLSSPVWRFALTPGVAGESGWAGVMIPSVDRVGRYFPLMLASPVRPTAVYAELPHAHSWYTQAEDIALSALDDESSFDLDAFSERLVQLGECPVVENALLANELSSVQQGWHVPLAEFGKAAQTARDLGDRLVRERFGQLSLWWTEGSELIAPCMLIHAGLPSPESFTAFLDGRWQESNWCTTPENTASSVVADALHTESV